MDNTFFELIIYLVIFLLYFLFGGNRIRLGGNDFFGNYDIDLGYDPLAEFRNEYNNRLRLYYRYNKPKLYLINRNCEAKLLKDKKGRVSFYVKERTVYGKQGKYFEVKGDTPHSYTMWSIIDMEFNELTRFDDIEELYKSLNQGYNTRGGMKYYKTPLFRKLPEPVKNESAQNEFCRLSINKTPSGRTVLVCSEIWGEENYKNPKEFIIIGDINRLFQILTDFSTEKNKMEDYITLLAKYAKRTDIKIEVVNKKDPEKEDRPEQRLNQPEKSFNPDEMKPLKTDIKTTPAEEYKKQQENRRKAKPDNIEESQSEKKEERNNMYNERKLDL